MKSLPLLTRVLTGAALIACVLVTPVFSTTTARDFADLSLEELMNETVRSVSKREQPLFTAASAITLVTHDDIVRSGATNLPDVLRMVPGVNVGAVNAREYAVSARGFSHLFAHNLLVLVDGRPAYTPLFAGVYWDVQQMMLEDLDRVEVIRGPGATIWGANAVNGVVNVVSRSARDTQGGLLYAGGGDIRRSMTGARQGGRLGENTYYRVFASHQTTADYPAPDGRDAGDGWKGNHGGFRVDHYTGPSQLTWQADATSAHYDEQGSDAKGIAFNTLARLTREIDHRSSFELQAYYDHFERDPSHASSTFDTFDLAAHHTFGLGERHDIIWGLGYRHTTSRFSPTTPGVVIRDDSLSQQVFSAFIQDAVKLLSDKVVLTAGIKIEHNDYTGIELQPSVRATYQPTSNQTLWAAVSRAVHTPSIVVGAPEIGIVIGPPIFDGLDPYLPVMFGNPDAKTETLLAFEVGYRIQPTSRVSIDVTAFYNDYSDVFTSSNSTILVPGFPVGTAEGLWVNSLAVKTYGTEASITAVPVDSMRITAAYTLLIAHVSGPRTNEVVPLGESAPRHQLALSSTYEFTPRTSATLQVRYMDSVKGADSYLTADFHLAYRPTDRVEISLVGQNLLEKQHAEQAPTLIAIHSEVPRSFYGKVSCRF